MVTHDRYFLDRVATRIVEVDQRQRYTVTRPAIPGFLDALRKSGRPWSSARRAEAPEPASQGRTRMAAVRGREPVPRSRRRTFSVIEDHAGKGTAPVQKTSQRADGVPSEFPAGQNDRGSWKVLCKAYGGRQLIRGFHLHFPQGRPRWESSGPNGCGKSTLLKMIVGEVEAGCRYH